MAPKPLPEQSLLLQLLRYDKRSGKLYWRARTADMFRPGRNGAEVECRRWNTKYANKEAFAFRSGKMGHLAGKIDYETYKAHRIIWKMIHGEEPGPEIDHRSGKNRNNRLSNLISGDKCLNQRNCFRRRDNKSVATGVAIRPNGKWQVHIRENGRQATLGTFSSFKEAVAARKAAERRLGYSDRHGERKRS